MLELFEILEDAAAVVESLAPLAAHALMGHKQAGPIFRKGIPARSARTSFVPFLHLSSHTRTRCVAMLAHSPGGRGRGELAEI